MFCGNVQYPTHHTRDIQYRTVHWWADANVVWNSSGFVHIKNIVSAEFKRLNVRVIRQRHESKLNRTREKMFLVSWRVATLSQLNRSMRANRALLAWTSEGMVLKNFGNIVLSERVGVLAPYDTCATDRVSTGQAKKLATPSHRVWDLCYIFNTNLHVSTTW